jgi:hypothetical protein
MIGLKVLPGQDLKWLEGWEGLERGKKPTLNFTIELNSGSIYHHIAKATLAVYALSTRH